MAEEVSRGDTVKIAKKSWKAMSLKQRSSIVRSLGFDVSFAKAKTMEELVRRDGGMVARSFHNLVKEYLKRNPGVNSVRFT
jgi:hypothetical protein